MNSFVNRMPNGLGMTDQDASFTSVWSHKYAPHFTILKNPDPIEPVPPIPPPAPTYEALTIEDRTTPVSVNPDVNFTQLTNLITAFKPVYSIHTGVLDDGNGSGGQGMASTSDNSYIMLGIFYQDGTIYNANSFQSVGVVNTYTNSKASLIMKYDSDGNFVWLSLNKVYTGTNPAINFSSLALDTSDNIYIFDSYINGNTIYESTDASDPPQVILTTQTNVSGYSRACLVKRDNAGYPQWQVRFDPGLVNDFQIEALKVATQSTNVYTLTRFLGNVLVYGTNDLVNPSVTVVCTTPNTFKNLLLVQHNSAGAYQWFAQTTGLVPFDDPRYFEDMCVDESENAVYASYTFSDTTTSLYSNNVLYTQFSLISGRYECVVFKLDGAGAYQWATHLQCAGGNDVFITSLKKFGNNIYICFNSGNTVTVGSISLSGGGLGLLVLDSTTGEALFIQRVCNPNMAFQNCRIEVDEDGFYVNLSFRFSNNGLQILNISDGSPYSTVTFDPAEYNFISTACVTYNALGQCQSVNSFRGTTYSTFTSFNVINNLGGKSLITACSLGQNPGILTNFGINTYGPPFLTYEDAPTQSLLPVFNVYKKDLEEVTNATLATPSGKISKTITLVSSQLSTLLTATDAIKVNNQSFFNIHFLGPGSTVTLLWNTSYWLVLTQNNISID